MESKGYHRLMKQLATVAIIGQGLYYAMTQPSLMDVINGSIDGLALYAIWFACERTQ